MSKNTLTVQTRKITGRKVKSLRRDGIVPANVFSKSTPSQTIQVDEKAFLRLRKQVGESSLIYLELEGSKQPLPVMVSDATIHPVTRRLLHVSFHQVNLAEKVSANVALKIVGVAPAEKDGLGILVQQTADLEIEALPADMPDHLDVDVSGLIEVDQSILASQVKLPAKTILKSDPTAIVVKIEPLAKEEPKEAPVAPAEAEAATAVPAAEGESTPAASPAVESKPKPE